MRRFNIVALLALASCGGGDNGSAARDSLSPATTPENPEGAPAADSARGAPAAVAEAPGGIVFDPATLSRGSKVGSLEADMLTVSRAADSVTLVGTVRFTGELTLTGRAIPHVDSDVHEVCFEADAASAAGIPRWSGDKRRAWFCFSNQPEAQRSLAALHETRPATVVVDRFTIHRGLTDQVNSAELVRVVTRGNPVP
jgi:hypothetical protein